MTIPLKDMIAELHRELRHRQIVYPGLIKRGGLTQAAADRQNARLQATLDLLVSLPEIDDSPMTNAERCQTPLSPVISLPVMQ